MGKGGRGVLWLLRPVQAQVQLQDGRVLKEGVRESEHGCVELPNEGSAVLLDRGCSCGCDGLEVGDDCPEKPPHLEEDDADVKRAAAAAVAADGPVSSNMSD